MPSTGGNSGRDVGVEGSVARVPMPPASPPSRRAEVPASASVAGASVGAPSPKRCGWFRRQGLATRILIVVCAVTAVTYIVGLTLETPSSHGASGATTPLLSAPGSGDVYGPGDHASDVIRGHLQSPEATGQGMGEAGVMDVLATLQQRAAAAEAAKASGVSSPGLYPWELDACVTFELPSEADIKEFEGDCDQLLASLDVENPTQSMIETLVMPDASRCDAAGGAIVNVGAGSTEAPVCAIARATGCVAYSVAGTDDADHLAAWLAARDDLMCTVDVLDPTETGAAIVAQLAADGVAIDARPWGVVNNTAAAGGEAGPWIDEPAVDGAEYVTLAGAMDRLGHSAVDLVVFDNRARTPDVLPLVLAPSLGVRQVSMDIRIAGPSDADAMRASVRTMVDALRTLYRAGFTLTQMGPAVHGGLGPGPVSQRVLLMRTAREGPIPGRCSNA